MKRSFSFVLFVCLSVFFISSFSKGDFTQEVNGAKFELVRIPGGTFQMGSISFQGQIGLEASVVELPVRQVTLSSFYIGKYEVTQGQWKAVMGSNPSFFKKGDDYPVEQVRWDDVQAFIRKLNQMTGKRYRLPTEAEWEYAARGGKDGPGNDRYGNLDDIAWHGANSGGSTHPVGQKQPNAYGLYDMLGNVWEWVQDWFGPYTSSAKTNPTGPSSGSYRVRRGGSWRSNAIQVRAPFRDGFPLGDRARYLGFRLAMDG